MNDIQRKAVEKLRDQAEELMKFLENRTGYTKDLNTAHEMLDKFKTGLERNIDFHHSIRETLASFTVRRGSHPDRSEWFSQLYDASDTLGYWLDQYKKA